MRIYAEAAAYHAELAGCLAQGKQWHRLAASARYAEWRISSEA